MSSMPETVHARQPEGDVATITVGELDGVRYLEVHGGMGMPFLDDSARRQLISALGGTA